MNAFVQHARLIDAPGSCAVPPSGLRDLARASHWREKICQLRGDECGNVMLLSGIMAFVAAILGLLCMDTGQAIHNRIVAQNAADAAADSAALWEARGCNLLQHLNNVHYTINRAAFIGESAALASCIAADGLVPATVIPIFGKIALPFAFAACFGCSLAPIIDEGQGAIATTIELFQEGVRSLTPFYAIWQANRVAKGNSINPDDLVVTTAFRQFGGELARRSGIPAPNFDLLNKIPFPPLYAIPLRIDLGLGVEKKAGDSLPWKTPDWWNKFAEVDYKVGKKICSYFTWEGAFFFQRYFDALPEPNPWGWSDSYYHGNPGYMTWMTGRVRQSELAGLSNLVWMVSGNVRDSREIDQAMYTGPSFVNESQHFLTIPSFIAFASSQVEGDPVVDHGPANAQGKLIKVYFPGRIPGERFLIYH